MARTILVTGATGNVGAALIEQLRGRDVRVVAAVRDLVRARRRLGAGIEYLPFDFARPETYSAFNGVDSLFLVRPPEIADVRHLIAPAIEAAQRAGVRRVVFLSILGVERNPIVPHYRIEKALRESGMAWTSLRASYFMQNLDTVHRDDLRRGAIVVPAGSGKTSFIDVRDIAAVGALALTTDGHENRGYALTGARALSYFEVARQFTAVLGRPVVYRNPAPLAYLRHMRRQGYPWPFALITLALYTTARLGLAAAVTDDVARLLGRPPISLRRYIEDYQQVIIAATSDDEHCLSCE